MPKNYYIVLGVPPGATQTDIKAAYRRLAKELHPDHYGKNQAPFQVLQEAYAVLGDPERRRAYDDSLEKPARAQRPRYEEPLGQHFEQYIEPLIPEQGDQLKNRGQRENSGEYRWPADSIHACFLEDPAARRRACRRFWALLRVMM